MAQTGLPPDLTPPTQPGFKDSFARFLRLWSWATVSGMLVGVVVLGVLGRIAMRVLAVTSGDAVQGAFSDDAEEIGRITAEGTIGFIVFIGIGFGALGGWVYALLRPLLPSDRRRRVLASGVIAAAIGAVVLVNPDGRDFSILGPLWLVVVLFITIPLLYGVGVSLVAERLHDFYETTRLRFPQVLAFLPMALLIPAPPLLVVGLLAGVVYSALRRSEAPGGIVAVGRVVLIAATTLLVVIGATRVAQLESREPTPADFVEPEFE